MKILLLAGEESGIFYAERLKAQLNALTGEPIEYRGYAEEGFKTHDLAVMGIGPVLMKLFYFLGVRRTMKRVIDTWQPDIVVSIDYPGMNLQLAAYAKARGIPAVHLCCPQVWAWHQGRIPKIAAALTKLLCFFPFEPKLFAPYVGKDFSASFIGHPMVAVFAEEEGARTRNADALPWLPGKRIALLPGSRKGEIERVLPRLLEAADILNERIADIGFLVPAASPRARRQIDAILAGHPVKNLVVTDGHAREILRSADVAAVTSGTATLEAAFAHVPTLLVYATTPFFAWVLRYFVTGVRYAGLVNLIWERAQYPDGLPPRRKPGENPGKGGPMPELLQEELTGDAVAGYLSDWLGDAEKRTRQMTNVDEVMSSLVCAGRDAFANAAQEILACLSK